MPSLTCRKKIALAASGQHQFQHGLGNIRKIQIPQYFLSVFSYEYTHVVMVQGSSFFGSPAWTTPCTPNGRPTTDDFLFWAGYYDDSVPIPGDKIAILGCKDSQSKLTRWGCVNSAAASPTIASCLLEYPNSPATRCHRCQMGTIRAASTQDICMTSVTDCFVIKGFAGLNKCLLCKDTQKSTTEATGCADFTELSSQLYMPQLQTVFENAVEVLFGPFTPTTIDPNLYQSETNLTVLTLSSVMVRFKLDYNSVRGSQAVRGTVRVLFDSTLVLIQTLSFIDGDNSAGPLQVFHAYSHYVPQNTAFKITVVVEGSGFSIGSNARVSITPYSYLPAACQLTLSNGACQACNWQENKYLTNPSFQASPVPECSDIPASKYPVPASINLPEQLKDCDTTCRRCLFQPDNCTACAEGKLLWTKPFPGRGSCETVCPSTHWPNLAVFPPRCDLCISPCAACVGNQLWQCKSCANLNQKVDSTCDNAIPGSSGCCVLCTVPNCNLCSAPNVCAQCSSGYTVSGGGSACEPLVPSASPTPANQTIVLSDSNKTNKVEVTMRATWDNTKLLYTLSFSRQVNVSLFSPFASLSFEQSLMFVELPCLTDSITLRTSCQGQIKNLDGSRICS